jgi:serine/threonine protein kinase
LAASTAVSDYLVKPASSSSGQLIALGSASRVCLQHDPETGMAIAVKHVQALSSLADQGFLREVECMAKLNHPCVLRILGSALPDSSGDAQIHTRFAERGSLKDVLLPRDSFLTRTQMGIIICDIVLGMRYVHSKHIIHKDLKPSNILVTGAGRALIADFGTSRFEFEDATLTPDSGTVRYAALELFEDNVTCTPKVDTFSFGLILFEILCDRPAFPNSMGQFEVIRALRQENMPPIPDSCGSLMQGLISRCWSKDPALRPSFPEIFDLFQSRDFAILPGADAAAIENAVAEVLAWETRSPR